MRSTSGPSRTYDRVVNAWCMYDWANSAFATTILAAVLPIYYSQVAGATLPSEARATAYWSAGVSLSLFIAAILSPFLGTVSDVMRGKKRFLAVFAGLGIVGTGLLVLVDTGDWLLASLLFVIGRIGFTAANVFYVQAWEGRRIEYHGPFKGDPYGRLNLPKDEQSAPQPTAPTPEPAEKPEEPA